MGDVLLEEKNLQLPKVTQSCEFCDGGMGNLVVVRNFPVISGDMACLISSCLSLRYDLIKISLFTYVTASSKSNRMGGS